MWFPQPRLSGRTQQVGRLVGVKGLMMPSQPRRSRSVVISSSISFILVFSIHMDSILLFLFLGIRLSHSCSVPSTVGSQTREAPPLPLELLGLLELRNRWHVRCHELLESPRQGLMHPLGISPGPQIQLGHNLQFNVTIPLLTMQTTSQPFHAMPSTNFPLPHPKVRDSHLNRWVTLPTRITPQCYPKMRAAHLDR